MMTGEVINVAAVQQMVQRLAAKPRGPASQHLLHQLLSLTMQHHVTAAVCRPYIISLQASDRHTDRYMVCISTQISTGTEDNSTVWPNQ